MLIHAAKSDQIGFALFLSLIGMSFISLTGCGGPKPASNQGAKATTKQTEVDEVPNKKTKDVEYFVIIKNAEELTSGFKLDLKDKSGELKLDVSYEDIQKLKGSIENDASAAYGIPIPIKGRNQSWPRRINIKGSRDGKVEYRIDGDFKEFADIAQLIESESLILSKDQPDFKIWSKEIELESEDAIKPKLMLLAKLATQGAVPSEEADVPTLEPLPDTKPTKQLTTNQDGTINLPIVTATSPLPFWATEVRKNVNAARGYEPGTVFYELLEAEKRAEIVSGNPRGLGRTVAFKPDLANANQGFASNGQETYSILSIAGTVQSSVTEILTMSDSVYAGQLICGPPLFKNVDGGPQVVEAFLGKLKQFAYASDGSSLGKLGFAGNDRDQYNEKVLAVCRRIRPAAKVKFEFGSYQTESELRTRFGLSGSGFGASASYNSDDATRNFRSSVFVMMRQEMFSVNLQDAPVAFDDWFDSEGKTAVPEVVKAIKESAPLLFVNKVQYGKIAILLVSGEGSSSDVLQAVKASFSGFGVEVNAELTESQKKTQSSLVGELFVHGGSAEVATELARSLSVPADDGRNNPDDTGLPSGQNTLPAKLTGAFEGLVEAATKYFAPEETAKSAQPIGFEARYLFGQQPAVAVSATHTTLRILDPVNIDYRIGLKELTLKDDGDVGFLFFGGHEGDWHIGFRQALGNSYEEWKQTGLLRLLDDDDRNPHDLSRFFWNFKARGIKESFQLVCGEVDQDDEKPIDENYKAERWDSNVSFGELQRELDLLHIIDHGKAVDPNGVEVQDVSRAGYRQMDMDPERGPAGNVLKWYVRVQVPPQKNEIDLKRISGASVDIGTLDATFSSAIPQ